MKLSIKKKYFDKIRSGEKTVEFRDAHITFVCEETGEQHKVGVARVMTVNKHLISWEDYDVYIDELDEMFDDDVLMYFKLCDINDEQTNE